jgi:predicted RNA-binding protein
MCQATVFVIENGEKQEVMREVAHLAFVEGGIQLAKLFEEPRLLRGHVTEIDFLRHTVTVVPEDREET